MMKRILLVCCLVAASAGFNALYAQTPDKAEPVSKSEYLSKVKELKQLMNKDKATEANAKYEEVKSMSMAELKVMRYKIRDCVNEAEKKELIALAAKQRQFYADAMRLSAADLTANKTELLEKLNSFGDTIQ